MIDKKKSEQYYNKGTIELENRNYEGALKLLMKSLEYNPSDIETLNNIGVVYLRTGNFEKAIEFCNKGIQINSKHISLWHNKGMAYVYQGKFDEGIECLKEVLKIAPDEYSTRHLISNLITQKEMFKNMIPQENQYSIKVKDNLKNALTLLQMGKLDESREIVKSVIKAKPKIAESWLIYGEIEFFSNNYARTLENCKKALELKPTLEMAWSLMGTALDQLNMYEKALQCCDNALEINPDSSSAWNNKALTLDIIGRYHDAIECYAKSLELNPHKAGNWFNKGETHNKLGEYQKALDCYIEAIKIDPNFSKAMEMIDLLKIKTSIDPKENKVHISLDIRDYCPRCGKKNYVRGTHCVYCGNKLLS